MSRIQRITDVLTKQFQPDTLQIIDQSTQHAGHGNVPPEAQETHLHIIISAAGLNDKSRVEQHRSIMSLLNGEFDSGLHALSIEVKKAA